MDVQVPGDIQLLTDKGSGDTVSGMDPAALLQGRTRETRIRRDAQGRWWNGDDPIDHPRLVRAFDAWIDIAEDGRYCLKNRVNWAYVTIEGPPLFVKHVELSDEQAVVELSDGTAERLDPATLRQDATGALYCSAREGTLAARFTPDAMQRLEPIVREDEKGVYLALEGGRARPPVVADPLARPPSVEIDGEAR